MYFLINLVKPMVTYFSDFDFLLRDVADAQTIKVRKISNHRLFINNMNSY
jgi:hypothetical protein